MTAFLVNPIDMLQACSSPMSGRFDNDQVKEDEILQHEASEYIDNNGWKSL
jgi:hypothetical protein